MQKRKKKEKHEILRKKNKNLKIQIKNKKITYKL